MGRVFCESAFVNHAERLARVSGLYGIVDDGADFALPPVAWARALVAGGARVLQLRFKRTPLGHALAVAREVRAALPHTVLLIDDRADLCLLCGADGVHVGEADLSPSEIRTLLGPDLLVGATARDAQSGTVRLREGADHLGVGPIFASGTKSQTVPLLGTAGLSAICRCVAAPVVAISGIDETNISQVAAAGADAAAVISAVGRTGDPAAAARRLSEAFATGAQRGNPVAQASR